MNQISGQKNLYFVLLALAIVVVGVLTYLGSSKTYDIRGVSGIVTSIEGDSITIKGFYKSDSLLPKRLSREQNITFKVDSNTTFKKTVYQMPSKEELIASGKISVSGDENNYSYIGSYRLTDDDKTEETGSASDIAEKISDGGMTMQAVFPVSIHKSDSRVASEVSYTIILSPVTND